MPHHLSRILTTLSAVILLPLLGCESTKEWVVTKVTPINWNGQSRIELPLTIDKQRHLRVPARIMGKDSTVILDTGASLSLMSRVMLGDARIHGSVKTNGSKFDTAQDVLVELGAASLNLGMVVIHDKGEERFVLGGGLFFQAIVDIDIKAGRLTLIKPDVFQAPTKEPVLLKRSNAQPVLNLKVNGIDREICATVDTGFGGGVALTPEIASELNLPVQPGRMQFGESFDGKRQEVPALKPLSEVSISGRTYHNVSVMGAVPNAPGPCKNLLGMEILARHHVIFDLKRNRLWLLPLSNNSTSH